MRLCGHTMGMPAMDLFQSLAFLPTIGVAAIEVRVHANGQINPATTDAAFIARAKSAARETGVRFACLTPYYKDFYTPAVRDREMAGMRQVVQLAHELECPLVRAYGGILPPPGVERVAVWRASVQALQLLADEAAPLGVTLVVETHTGTLTMAAGETARFVADIGRANVGILFDWVWVQAAGQENLREAVALCGRFIRHVHVKDCVFEGAERKPPARLMGEGEVDLRGLIAELRTAGYQGYLCDEYEKFWQAHLPEPAVGMGHNADHLRSILATLA